MKGNFPPPRTFKEGRKKGRTGEKDKRKGERREKGRIYLAQGSPKRNFVFTPNLKFQIFYDLFDHIN